MMDSLVTAAASALAAGDPLGALNRIALRDDPPSLALRGIAMAQLGDLARARALVRSAARAFGPREALARARCVVAEAEIALAARELNWPGKALAAARATLEAHGDRLNATHARYVEIRRLLLVGQLDDAHRQLAALDTARLPPAARATHALIEAGIAMRRIHADRARAALAAASAAAHASRIPALRAEIEHARRLLDAPAARLVAGGAPRLLTLDDVQALFASPAFVVDACRHVVRDPRTSVVLARRPVLFALVRALAEAWPRDVPRDELVARAFRLRLADESHRARLRVEIGRLRAMLRELADVNATARGFVLAPHAARDVIVLERPVDEAHAGLLALLADGEAWSSSALALALGTSQRTVQRALDALAQAGKVQPLGRARARRWTMPPLPGFATPLLLAVPLPDG